MFSEEASVIIHRTAYVRLFPGEDRASEHAIGRKTVSPLRAHLVALYTFKDDDDSRSWDELAPEIQPTDRPSEAPTPKIRPLTHFFLFLSLSLGHPFVRDITHVGKHTQNSSLDSNFGLRFGNSGLAAVKAIL